MQPPVLQKTDKTTAARVVYTHTRPEMGSNVLHITVIWLLFNVSDYIKKITLSSLLLLSRKHAALLRY